MENLKPQQELPLEVLTTTDPLEAEKALLKQKEQQAFNRSPEDVAAGLFSTYWPIFSDSLDIIGKKSLKRIIRFLIETPLNEKEYKFFDKKERQIVAIAERLLQAKWEMMLHTLMKAEQEKQLETQAKEAAGTEVVATLNEEQKNG
jgi:hypothetical protein